MTEDMFGGLHQAMQWNGSSDQVGARKQNGDPGRVLAAQTAAALV